MKIDTKDIRQRLSNNTAIDKEEIEALCDEVEGQRLALKAIYNELEALDDWGKEISVSTIELVIKSIYGENKG